MQQPIYNLIRVSYVFYLESFHCCIRKVIYLESRLKVVKTLSFLESDEFHFLNQVKLYNYFWGLRNVWSSSMIWARAYLRSSSWLCARACATRSSRSDRAVRGLAPPLLSPPIDCSSSTDMSEGSCASCSYTTKHTPSILIHII